MKVPRHLGKKTKFFVVLPAMAARWSGVSPWLFCTSQSPLIVKTLSFGLLDAPWSELVSLSAVYEFDKLFTQIYEGCNKNIFEAFPQSHL